MIADLKLDFSVLDGLFHDMDQLSPNDQPLRIGFLLIDDFALMSYAAASEPLRAANLLAGRTLFSVRNLAVMGGQAFSSSGTVVRATAQVGEQSDFDIMFVVAGGDPHTFSDRRIFQWLRHLSRRGVVLGGVSGGPVILAAAGLMKDRRMTVHWEHAATLAEEYPGLYLERSLFVMDRDRITCAGGTAPLDMMHALIAGRHGESFAREVSDWFMHTAVRVSGDPQRAGMVERYRTTSAPVIRAIEAMEAHIDSPLSLAEIARQAGVGSRQLNRLFSEKLGQGTMAFYRDLRLEKARNLLEHSLLSVTEIALATGFCSSAHFSKAFRTRFATTPSALRQSIRV